MISREQIESRLADLQAQLSKAQATMLAIDGAIQDCQHWLAICDVQDSPGVDAKDLFPGAQLEVVSSAK